MEHPYTPNSLLPACLHPVRQLLTWLRLPCSSAARTAPESSSTRRIRWASTWGGVWVFGCSVGVWWVGACVGAWVGDLLSTRAGVWAFGGWVGCLLGKGTMCFVRLWVGWLFSG